jgi:hypothetical protein
MKNLIFLKVKSLVILCPDDLRYSQDLMAKKNAPMKSSQRAKSIGEIDDL